jgi:hypothetical protein
MQMKLRPDVAQLERPVSAGNVHAFLNLFYVPAFCVWQATT